MAIDDQVAIMGNGNMHRSVVDWSLYKRIKQVFDVAILYLRYQSTSRSDLETCSQISSSPTELYLVELEEEI